MSYIKKELLIADILDAKIRNTREDSRDVLNIFERMVQRQPDVDVVEVVRCKDCVHYKPYQKPVEDFDGTCFARSCETDEQDFCNYGKRQTD